METNWRKMNIQELVDFLNKCCDAYYDEDNPIISDKEYDDAYDRLVALENSTGIHLAGSPTRKVQGHVSDKFVKVTHSKPMLSCQKTKSPDEVEKWANGQEFYCSYKMDGCFISSTRIKMADGTEKRISDVKVGDYVLSCNDSGQVEPKRVINTFYNGLKPQSEWVKVFVDDGHKKGKHGGIKCTKNHKFFTNKGWVEAENLSKGDLVYFPHRVCSAKQNEVLLGICLEDATLLKRGTVGSKLNVVEINTSKTKNGGYDILWEEDNSFIGLSPRKIVSVETCVKSKEHSVKSYDLEVEDNHNYFANNTLVHNCTLVLKYNSGKLIQAITRGNGTIGEDVTENAKMISNIPLTIPFPTELELRGECVMSWDAFNKINSKLSEPYSHPRNLAAGTIRQLDSTIVRERKLSFVVFEVISKLELFDNKMSKLEFCKHLGFETVEHMTGTVEECVASMTAEKSKYPVDGLVFEYTSEKYGNSLGATAHHEQQRIALKWADDVVDTTLRDVVWQVGQSGTVTPVAVFDEVDLSGAMTSRATLHNLSIVEKLELGIGDIITVYRSNMVIPKVDDNITRSNTLEVPTVCPCCGKPLVVDESGESKFLVCTNNSCPAKVLAKFTRFVERNAMNIDGLSEKTLELLIDLGYVKTFKDIYHISDYSFDLMKVEGLGKTSVEKLINSIENSRSIKLENYLYAIGIDGIGLSACKEISKTFDGDYDKFISAISTGFDMTSLNGFGESAQKSIDSWFNEEDRLDIGLEKEMHFILPQKVDISSNIDKFSCADITVCITGKLNNYTRDELTAKIEELGGKVASSVSKNTTYLITNELSQSSKSRKAIELGVQVISEEEFVKKYFGG